MAVKKMIGLIWLPVTIVMMLIVVGGCHSNKIASEQNKYPKYSYKNVRNQSIDGIKRLKSKTKQNRDTFIVIYNDKCSDCQTIEPSLVKEIIKIRDETKSSVYVFDINKLSKGQLKYLTDNVTDLAVDGRIITPRVIKTKYAHGQFLTTASVTGTDMLAIRKLMEDG